MKQNCSFTKYLRTETEPIRKANMSHKESSSKTKTSVVNSLPELQGGIEMKETGYVGPHYCSVELYQKHVLRSCLNAHEVLIIRKGHVLMSSADRMQIKYLKQLLKTYILKQNENTGYSTDLMMTQAVI